MSRRGSVRAAAGAAALVAAFATLTGPSAGPVSAHSNGRAVVLVRQFTLQPSASGWVANVTLADFDSGSPIRDSKVIVVAGDPAAAAAAPAPATTTTQTAASKTTAGKTTKTAAAAPAGPQPTLLAPSATAIGQYAGQLSAKPGPAQVQLSVRTVPGEAPVAPFDKAWDVTLVAGKPLAIVAGESGGGGSNVGLIVGVAGGVVGVALLYGLFVVRRRTAVPAGAANAKRA
jgi:hypothetical protein